MCGSWRDRELILASILLILRGGWSPRASYAYGKGTSFFKVNMVVPVTRLLVASYQVFDMPQIHYMHELISYIDSPTVKEDLVVLKFLFTQRVPSELGF